MSRKLLNQFFRQNKVEGDTPTTPAFAHFYLSMEANPESNEKIQNVMNEAVFKEHPEREAEALSEKSAIEAATTAAEIIRFMRRHTDPLNQHVLVDKAMEFEDEIVPEVVRMLKTSMNDGFIESAIRVLAKSKINCADEIIGYYDDMRHPYAQSMALVLLGFKAEEVHIPWFIDKYKELKKLYPHESYCEGAYYALYEMEGRFYPAGKGKK